MKPDNNEQASIELNDKASKYRNIKEAVILENEDQET